MAIPSGSGTEVLKSKLTVAVVNSFQDVVEQLNNANKLIIVLSIIIHEGSGASGHKFIMQIVDNDGSSNPCYLYEDFAVGSVETFVHNDKFCLVGDKRLMIKSTSPSSNFDVTATYIIQDWT